MDTEGVSTPYEEDGQLLPSLAPLGQRGSRKRERSRMYLETLREALVGSCCENVESCEEVGVSKSTSEDEEARRSDWEEVEARKEGKQS